MSDGMQAVDDSGDDEMIKDSQGVKINIGDVCFYSERPHSNYADSLVEVFLCDEEGMPKVRTLVVNGLSGNEYEYCGHIGNELPLENYTWDYKNEPTDTCDHIRVITGLSPGEATIEYAENNYPLSQ